MATPGAESKPTERRLVRRIVLLGYMCSGKSTVGEALARRLEWDFLDFDVEIERREGRIVREIIDADGAEYFEGLEVALTEEIANADTLVIAPGGGWITRPELLNGMARGTLAVWLYVTPEETVRRLKADTIARPFKDMDDPTERIASMIAEREPLFRLADVTIPADVRSIESVAYEIEQMVRTRGVPKREAKPKSASVSGS
jgi:shikimate kinase